MLDWKVVTKILAGAGGATVAGGSTSFYAQPTAPWQVHAAAGGTALAAYLVGLYQQSPRA